jgi:hypothetical protein
MMGGFDWTVVPFAMSSILCNAGQYQVTPAACLVLLENYARRNES